VVVGFQVVPFPDGNVRTRNENIMSHWAHGVVPAIDTIRTLALLEEPIQHLFAFWAHS
jgi:hypothetical protein